MSFQRFSLLENKLLPPIAISHIHPRASPWNSALGVISGSEPTPDVLLMRVIETIAIPYGREVAKIMSMEQLKAIETHNKVKAEKYLEKIVVQLAKVSQCQSRCNRPPKKNLISEWIGEKLR